MDKTAIIESYSRLLERAEAAARALHSAHKPNMISARLWVEGDVAALHWTQGAGPYGNELDRWDCTFSAAVLDMDEARFQEWVAERALETLSSDRPTYNRATGFRASGLRTHRKSPCDVANGA